MKIKLRTLVAFLLLFACLLLSVGCGEKDESEQPPENMQHATAEGSLYRLYIPTGWNSLSATGRSGGYASLQSLAAIHVYDYANEESLSPRAWVETAYLPTLETVYGENEVGEVTLTDTTLDGIAACEVNYASRREEVGYKTRATVAAFGERIYVVYFTSQGDLFDQYAATLESILQAFCFTDKPFVPDNKNTPDLSVPAPEGMKLISTNDVAYRFFVPADWVVDLTLPSSAYVSESDRSNVNVTSRTPDVTVMTAEEYWQICEAEYQSALRDYTLLSATAADLDGRPANTYVFGGKIGGVEYRFAQTIATLDGVIYAVTYTSAPDLFESHMEEYTAMLAAFDFRGN